jgi:hypothetical protein
MDTYLLYYFSFFVIASSIALYKLDKSYVVGAAFMIGWLFLPSYVFQIAEMPKEGIFPFWILGSSVPSLDWFSKAWFIPSALLFVTLALDRQRYQNLSYIWPDAFILLWCLWPSVQSLLASGQEPSGWVQSLYLLGAWGAPWFIGRAYYSTPADQLRLIKILVLSCMLYLPVSIVEGFWGPFLHEYFYSASVFRYDGFKRYFGFRPSGFLEHGNQFGAVVSLTAVLAIWLARLAVGPRAIRYRLVAMILFLMMLASQSVGAIGLAFLGIALIFLWDRFNAKLYLFLSLVVVLGIGSLYVLTADVGHWMWNSSLGQWLVGFTKSIGRGSFAWRVSADQAALSIARADIYFGTGNWAWWRPAGIRPWGLPQVLIGQFGIIAVLMAFIAISSGAIAHVFGSTRELTRQPKGGGLVLGITLLLAIGDALMNSFIYFPLLLLGGALASKAPTIGYLRSFLTR